MSNQEYASDVFSMLLEDKKNALNVYNGLNNTTYYDPELVEICTLERGISLSIRNDAAFIVASDLNMYEHQSTYNPNMPLRNLLYLTKTIKPILKGQDLYGSKLIKIPTPRFVTFYNGAAKRPETEIFKLSDSFENKTNTPALELTVTCYNINPGFNEELLNRTSILREYMQFVNKVRELKTNDDIGEPVSQAIDYCIENNILRDFLITRRSEVQKAMVIDMTFETREKLIKRDSYEEGYNSGVNDGYNSGVNNEKSQTALIMLKANEPLDRIMQFTRLDAVAIKAIADANGLTINK